MDDDQDLDLDGLDDGEAGSGDSGDDAEPTAPPTRKPAEGANESKRINDLMSKWQKAESARKAAEARVKELEGTGAKPKDGGEEIPAAVRQWMNAAKDAARERFYNADPRLAEYGIELSAIDGETPDEMSASAKRYRSLIDAIETKAQAKVMAEHGIVPETPGSGAPAPTKSFGQMSDEEIERYIAQTTGRSW